MVMNILTVADFFYPDIVGGSAVMAYQLMLEMVKRGHGVTVLTRSWGKGAGERDLDGMRILRYEMPARQTLYPLAVARSTRALGRILAKERFDVVNMHHSSGGIAAELVKFWTPDLPSVFFFQGPWHGEAMAREGVSYGGEVQPAGREFKYLLRKKIDNFILRRCDAYITLSDYMQREALAISPGSEGKWFKLSGGVDTRRFFPATDRRQVRAELDLPQDKILLLAVRRLDPRMGLENLLEAMALIEARRDDVVLLIGGKGELESELRRLIKERGLRNAVLLGFIEDDLLAKYFQACNMSVVPSVTLEGYGLSTLESLACGVPVLGTLTGGATPEVLGGILPDFLVSDLRAETIAEAVLRLVPAMEAWDGKQVSQLRAFAEERSWQRVADQVEIIFQRLVAGQTARALEA
jgi:glycosyltransferase involved in cell wall biosynthesis